MTNLYLDSLRKKREKAHINKIRNETEITTYNTEIQSIIKEYYKQLYVNKLDNLEEMDYFIETFNHTRLNYKETDILNRLITSKEIETIIKNLPQNKSPGTDGFIGEF